MKTKLPKFLLIGSMMLCTLASCGETETSGLELAKDYVKALYRDKATATPSDYELVSVVTIDGVKYSVSWTVNNDKVKVVSGDTLTTIDVDEKSENDEAYTLTATITDSNGKTITTSFEHKVPKFVVYSYAEYVNLADDVTGSFRGIVTGIIAKSRGNSSNCLYVEGADGGFYVYGLSTDPVTDDGVEIGDQVLITGAKDTYSGTHEIASASIEIEKKGVGVPAPTDITSTFNSLTSVDELKTTMATVPQASLVTIKGVELSPVTADDTSSGYYKFKNTNGVTTYSRISSSVCPILADEQATFIANHTSHVGYLADITGVVCAYDGAFYLTPVSVDAEANFQLPKLSDPEMVAKEKENLLFDAKFGEDTTGKMAIVGGTYEDVKISWASDNEAVIAFDNAAGTYTVTCPEEDTTVKVTATLTANSASDTAEFEVLVEAAATDLYLPNFIEAPAAGTYKIAMDCRAVDDKVWYFDGTFNSKTAGICNEKATKGVDVVVEEVEGGYTLKVGEQYLTAFIDGKYKDMKLADEPFVWVWNDEIKTFVAVLDDVQYYWGSYMSKGTYYTTMALSDIKYVTGDNLVKVGESQFVSRFCTLQPAAYKPNWKKDTPVAGTYKLGINTAAVDGKVWYFDGTFSSKGALQSTEKVDKAVDVVVEVVEGGYTLKVGEQYLTAYQDGKYVDAKLGDEAYVWGFDTATGTFTCVFDGTTYYFGSYISKGSYYTTFASSKIDYISGDNVSKIDVSQFPMELCSVKVAPVKAQYVDTLKAGTYKIAINVSAVDGKTLYFDGTFTSKGYLNTTDKISKAVDVVVEEVEGGFTFKVGEQYLVAYQDGKYVDAKLSEEAFVWQFDNDTKTFTCVFDGTTYYFGSYISKGAYYTTLGASKIDYISGDNLSKIDVSQFPAHFCTIVFAD